jgi:hypothetical protein
MKNDVELHDFHMNFVECLTSFMEGRATLPMIFQLNERIYNRDRTALSQSLIEATKTLHHLKERIDHGEKVDQDTINTIINDSLLKLIDF